MIDPEKLAEMVTERAFAWYSENNNTYPKNILYYRDGVSESQYKTVKDKELPSIVKGFEAFVEQSKVQGQGKGKGKAVDPPKVKITAVVVTKRHHTRFYPKAPKDKQAGNGNCKPGTLVERGVTSPYFTDFYLQSHNGIKGTAKPAHYWLLQNDMNMGIRDIQQLVRQTNSPH
jgi:eukaryotic translation initiation factor 2C